MERGKGMKKKYILAIIFYLLLVMVIVTGVYIADSLSENDRKDYIQENSMDKTSASEDKSVNDKANERNSDDGADEKGNVTQYSEDDRIEIINSEGVTLKTRFRTPKGYTRIKAGKDSFATFVRNYPLKKDGKPVLLYNGERKGNQNVHAAVFKLPIEEEDLQQCADSVMRMYGEYFYEKGKYADIAFSFGNGFVADFSKWSSGYGISVNGNDVSWVFSGSNDASYASFKKFMRMVFAYAGTMTLEEESESISLKEIRTGDIFIRGGSPGHVVMVVDVCENAKGKKAFLLAQGYMPAQEFHVLKNPEHEDDAWYYQNEISYPLQTPEYTFERGSLKRPVYGRSE